MTVGLAEFVAIVTLNFCTIIVFIRNRNLRKRSMYLVINLAVIDMFVAGNAVYHLFYWPGIHCNLWNRNSEVSTIIYVLMLFGPGSLINIAFIALERMHATFCPFRHRVLKKWVYLLMIVAVWVTSGLLVIAYMFLVQFDYYYGRCLYFTYISISLLIICVSYSAIVIKIRYGAQPQHHGAASRERKLTMTLLIVTVVSLLFCLPHVIWNYVLIISKSEITQSLSLLVAYDLDHASVVLIHANSLVNPILYTMRMPEFRSALLALLCKRPQQQRQVAVFPLRGM